MFPGDECTAIGGTSPPPSPKYALGDGEKSENVAGRVWDRDNKHGYGWEWEHKCVPMQLSTAGTMAPMLVAADFELEYQAVCEPVSLQAPFRPAVASERTDYSPPDHGRLAIVTRYTPTSQLIGSPSAVEIVYGGDLTDDFRTARSIGKTSCRNMTNGATTR